MVGCETTRLCSLYVARLHGSHGDLMPRRGGMGAAGVIRAVPAAVVWRGNCGVRGRARLGLCCETRFAPRRTNGWPAQRRGYAPKSPPTLDSRRMAASSLGVACEQERQPWRRQAIWSGASSLSVAIIFSQPRDSPELRSALQGCRLEPASLAANPHPSTSPYPSGVVRLQGCGCWQGRERGVVCRFVSNF